MKLRKILITMLFLSSFPVNADTYPAVYQYYYNQWRSTLQESCQDIWQALTPYSSYHQTAYGGNQCAETHDGVTGVWTYHTVSTQYNCPNGGTRDVQTCLNAPPCISPQVRKLVSPYSCYTPIECAYPETDNGNGACQNISCPSGQARNPTTMTCQVKPTCGSTETYDVYTNTCKLYPLNCPGHTHANKANDACLEDAPLACPQGQHDNGTYTCVADDAKACRSDQQEGYINGVHQCITKTNAEQKAKDLETAKQAQATAKQNLTAAQQALEADPTNVTKQQAFSTAQTTYTESTHSAETAQADHDSGLLRSIDQTLKGSGMPTAITPVAGTALDAVTSAVGTAMQTDQAESIGQISSGFFNPTPNGCQSVAMNYKGLQYTFDPCGKLAMFRDMFGWFAYIFTAFSLFKLATERQD